MYGFTPAQKNHKTWENPEITWVWSARENLPLGGSCTRKCGILTFVVFLCYLPHKQIEKSTKSIEPAITGWGSDTKNTMLQKGYKSLVNVWHTDPHPSPYRTLAVALTDAGKMAAAAGVEVEDNYESKIYLVSRFVSFVRTKLTTWLWDCVEHWPRWDILYYFSFNFYNFFYLALRLCRTLASLR